MVGLVWSNDPESSAGGSIAISRVTQAGQVKGDDPDKKEHPGPPGWVLGVGGYDPILKKNLCSENLRDASDGINK